jgi:uncharacterized membrane protein
MRVARWVAPVSTVLALAGVGVSTYLTVAHYTDPTGELQFCSGTGTVDCGAVTTSAQSTFLGVPVALLGLLWFAGMLALCLPVAWRAEIRSVHLARLVGAIGGIGFVLWLIYAELIIIGAICVWCTVAHVIAFALFVVVVLTTPALLAED